MMEIMKSRLNQLVLLRIKCGIKGWMQQKDVKSFAYMKLHLIHLMTFS